MFITLGCFWDQGSWLFDFTLPGFSSKYIDGNNVNDWEKPAGLDKMLKITLFDSNRI